MKIEYKLALARQMLIISLLVFLAFFQGVYGIEITVNGVDNGEGGTVGLSFDLAEDATLEGKIAINGATVMPSTAISGPVSKFEETHAVKDATGKSASVSVKVLNAPNGLTYSSYVLPYEGTVSARPWVSAEQWLTVPRADSIRTTASASYGALSADVILEETKSSSLGDYVTLADYYGKAYASASQVDALQTAESASATSIRAYGQAKDSSSSLSIDTTINGLSGSSASIKGLEASSSAGTSTQITQSEHIKGTFTSTAKSGTLAKTRTSNYGTEYDLETKAAKGSSPTGIVGYYVDIANPSANKIQGAVNAAASRDSINVASGRYFENIYIDKSLSVKGAGSGSTIVDGNKAGTVFTLGNSNPNIDVILSGMSITGGKANYGGGIRSRARLTVEDSSLFGNTANYGGGAIYNAGTLNLVGNSISYNTATAKSAAPYSLGGGVYNSGTLTLTDNSMDHNYADGGGAIYNYGWGSGGAKLTMNSGRISDNTARFNGGAIWNDGVFTLNSGSLDRNSAMYGGAVFNWGIFDQLGGSMTYNHAIRSATPDPRQPAYYGGAGGAVFSDDNIGAYNIKGGSIKYNTADHLGGGVYQSGRCTMTGGEISYNHAQHGGGMVNDIESAGYFTMSGGSIDHNTADLYGGGLLNYGTATLKGGSISNNQAKLGGGIMADWGSKPITFSGTTLKIQNNKASIPDYQSSWYKGWGVYLADTRPTMINGFNPSTQVTSNTHV